MLGESGLGYDWGGLVDKLTGGIIQTAAAKEQAKTDIAVAKAQAAASRAAAGAPATGGGMSMNTMLMIGGGVAVVGLVLFLVMKKR